MLTVLLPCNFSISSIQLLLIYYVCVGEAIKLKHCLIEAPKWYCHKNHFLMRVNHDLLITDWVVMNGYELGCTVMCDHLLLFFVFIQLSFNCYLGYLVAYYIDCPIRPFYPCIFNKCSTHS